MFTGIITGIGELIEVDEHNDIRRLVIRGPFDPRDLTIGGSIACDGVCFTVVSVAPQAGGCFFSVDAAPETLEVTTVGGWRSGRRINLERALRLGDEIGGHLVTGHVDGRAKLVSREDLGGSVRMTLSLSRQLGRYVAPKGSVCVDGTSLTVNHVDEDGFSVLLIPHTLAVTTWGDREAGDLVNIEVDLLARYVARLHETAHLAA